MISWRSVSPDSTNASTAPTHSAERTAKTKALVGNIEAFTQRHEDGLVEPEEEDTDDR